MGNPRHNRLLREHRPENIAHRLQQSPAPSHLSDAVLGGIDGCITTFAIVAGAFGAGFSPMVVLVMGAANLLADGISMAVSNFEAVNAQQRLVDKARVTEELHIDLVPEGEREEVRQIFASKGFSGEDLENIVRTVTANRTLWVDTMLREEYGLADTPPDPLGSAWWTFATFLAVGMVPLLPFLVRDISMQTQFMVSTGLAGMMFFLIGLLKGWIYDGALLRAGMRTFVLGGFAAAVAYVVGRMLSTLL